MSENGKIARVDIPNLAKLEEHGITIDAPTPTQFVMPDPWTPNDNGQGPVSQQPAPSQRPAAPKDD